MRTVAHIHIDIRPHQSAAVDDGTPESTLKFLKGQVVRKFIGHVAVTEELGGQTDNFISAFQIADVSDKFTASVDRCIHQTHFAFIGIKERIGIRMGGKHVRTIHKGRTGSAGDQHRMEGIKLFHKIVDILEINGRDLTAFRFVRQVVEHKILVAGLGDLAAHRFKKFFVGFSVFGGLRFNTLAHQTERFKNIDRELDQMQIVFIKSLFESLAALIVFCINIAGETGFAILEKDTVFDPVIITFGRLRTTDFNRR